MARNGKKGAGGIIIVVLLAVIILVAGFVFATFDGIVGIISNIGTAVEGFFTDPISAILKGDAMNDNAFDAFFDIGVFDIDAYKDQQLNAKIFISLEQFNNMVEKLESSINRDASGLDDLTLKNMLLTYYKTKHLEDTELYIQLTEEEYNKNDDRIFEKVKEKKNEESKELPYLKTTGSVSIKVETQNQIDPFKKMVSMTEQGLRDIYINEYIKNLEKDGSESDYSKAVRKVLSRCYTIQGNSVKMIKFNIEEVKSIYEYKDANIKIEETKTRLLNVKDIEPQWINLDYATDIGKYAMPLEFLTSLMEISQSKQFIYKVMKLVDENTKIEMRLYDTKVIEQEEIIKNYTQDIIASANGKDKTHRDNVKHTKTITKTDYKYEIGVTEAKVWHSITAYENQTGSTKEKYYINTAGEKIYIIDKDNDFKLYVENEPEAIYTKNENSEMFNVDTHLKEIFNYTIKKEEEGYNYQDYNFNQMSITNTNITQTNLNTIEEITLVTGVTKVEDKTDTFLDLLKQEYESLYSGKSRVGELLVNGEEMFYELLERSSNSQGLVDIMRYIINRYKTGAEASDDLSNIYGLQAISGTTTIIGDTTENKIWYTLRSLGYSENAISGLMAYIDINNGWSGPFEWTGIGDWQNIRKVNLEIYAKTKNVEKDDINTQIEYLIGEITEGGGCNRICKISIRTC